MPNARTPITICVRMAYTFTFTSFAFESRKSRPSTKQQTNNNNNEFREHSNTHTHTGNHKHPYTCIKSFESHYSGSQLLVSLHTHTFAATFLYNPIIIIQFNHQNEQFILSFLGTHFAQQERKFPRTTIIIDPFTVILVIAAKGSFIQSCILLDVSQLILNHENFHFPFTD